MHNVNFYIVYSNLVIGNRQTTVEDKGKSYLKLNKLFKNHREISFCYNHTGKMQRELDRIHNDQRIILIHPDMKCTITFSDLRDQYILLEQHHYITPLFRN